MPATFTRDEILSQLDACARQFDFPMLDNGYVYLADVRLGAFRDDTRWALAIEVIGVNNRAGGHDGINNCLHLFGNCLKRPWGTANEDFLYFSGDGPDGPTFVDDSLCTVRPTARSIRIRDRIIEFNLNEVAAVHQGIDLDAQPEVHAHELLRWLVPKHRDLFLITEGELWERIPADLPLVLLLDEWHHPDLAGDEMPSDSLTFRMIADVLVTGDPSRYRPTREPNTHWRFWPEGGTL